jgi:hypothetical protein
MPRVLRGVLFSASLVGALPAPVAAAGDAITLDALPLLFVDDGAVASSHGLVRTVHAARTRPEPVIEPERPWEGEHVYTYGSVHRDPATGLFRLWYMAHSRVLHSTSPDGVTWTRTVAGLHDFQGSKDNNIVATGFHAPAVIDDAFERDPSKRFKLLGNTGGKFHGAHSVDGLIWHRYAKDPLFEGSDTSTLTQDPRTGEYLAYFKRRSDQVPGRVVWLTRSRDFVNWSEAKLVFHADAEDDRWAMKPDQRTEIYNMSVVPHAAGFVGFPTMFRVMHRIPRSQPVPGSQSRDDGPIDVQLVTSRDGENWARSYPRISVIPRGEPGTYDGGALLGVTSAAVHAGDETWMLYTAINTGHGGTLPPKRLTIGRATWRRHGFASLDANPAGGSLRSRPLLIAGGVLELNADASRGELRVELREVDGSPLPDFLLADCEPLRGDATRHRVSWKSDLPVPADRPLQVVVEMREARLFSLSGGAETVP